MLTPPGTEPPRVAHATDSPENAFSGAQRDGRRRVIIENVSPQIDCGRFAVKRTLGEEVIVEADIFADGHDVLAAVVLHRHGSDEAWRETAMTPLGNDRWRASFAIEQLGRYAYTIEAWVDHFESWRHDLEKKARAGQDVNVDLATGAQWVRRAAERAAAADRGALETWSDEFAFPAGDGLAPRVERALDPAMRARLRRCIDRSLATRFERELAVIADPVRARYGAWYEFFPRSCNSDGKRHGTFRDVEQQLPRVAAMGFDVLYLPPVHPIGEAFRKGRNNAAQAAAGDPGSPWAIGGAEGGHKAVHPALGTLEDFRRLVAAAAELKIDVALDIALQCSGDHPYLREHPEWFKRRADGSIQYAENPPKKYQDIYPFDFECAEWPGLWRELKSVMEFWAEQGVRIFRVDNPHTKAFPFWEWAIGDLKQQYPELILLSEAFTRPKVMYHLAKLGFTQSYNYFPWRNTARELREFMTELTRSRVREFYRPNLWPNTPDILPQYLQFGGRAGFMVRLILAATLGASYGIYGPAFELCVNQARQTGEEEYLDSEKYELKRWPLDAPDSLEPLITQVNRIRRENPALHSNELLAFHGCDNDELLVFSKRTPQRDNLILVVVNLDPHHLQFGKTRLALDELGIEAEDTFQVHDLLTDARYLWHGAANDIELDPARLPAAIFRVKRRIRTEHDFDYFL